MNNKKNNTGLVVLVLVAIIVIGGLIFLLNGLNRSQAPKFTEPSRSQAEKAMEQKKLEKVIEDNRMVYVFSGKIFKKDDGKLGIQVDFGEKEKLNFKLDPFIEKAKTPAEPKEGDYITVALEEPIYLKDFKSGTLHNQQLSVKEVIINEEEIDE